MLTCENSVPDTTGTTRFAYDGDGMNTAAIFTNLAVIFVALTLYDDLKRNDRLRPSHRTWLMLAGIFAIVGAVLKVAT